MFKGSSGRARFAALCAAMVFAVAACLPIGVFALQPPHPGEIASMERLGTLEQALASAQEIGNDRADPALLVQSRLRVLDRGVYKSTFGAELASSFYGKVVPTTGTLRTFVLLIDFPSSTNTQPAYPSRLTPAAIDARVFGSPSTRYPFESLHNYYLRSSHGLLDVQGTTFAWYHSPRTRDSVAPLSSSVNTQVEIDLIEEAIAAIDAAGHDFSQYDNNGDGRIDVFNVIWTGPEGNWSSFWWGHKNVVRDGWEVDGKTLGDYTWQNDDAYYPPNSTLDYPVSDFRPETMIHEFGHALGLPDYYDYRAQTGKAGTGGVGGFDEMDGLGYDHNAFSKYLLGWIDPQVVSSSTASITLRDAETYGDAVIVLPDAATVPPTGEYFIVENRRKVGNDWGDGLNILGTGLGGGLVVWHVDTGRIPGAITTDNSGSTPKLLQLVQADGRRDIETGSHWAGDGWADSTDLFRPGKSFTPTSTPSSINNIGLPTFLSMRNLTVSGASISADFGLLPTPRLLLNGGASYANTTSVSFAVPPMSGIPAPAMVSVPASASSVWTSVAAGASHTLAIRDDGSLWAWGSNDCGQLGDGSTFSAMEPVRIGAGNAWTMVAAAEVHSAALKTDGTLWTWGDNRVGQLGDGSLGRRTSPSQVGTSSDWVGVWAGGYHTFALKGDGTLWGWGSDSYYALGLAASPASPTRIGTANNWTAVAAGPMHTLALRSDGSLWAWGSGGYGALGLGTFSSMATPTRVGTSTNWKSVSAGRYHSVGIKTDGTLWVWGRNGGSVFRTTPTQVGASGGWSSVAAGDSFTGATRADGTLWTWGDPARSDLGDGAGSERSAPTQVGSATNWRTPFASCSELATGFAGGVTAQGEIMAFGNNCSGQLGTGTTVRTPLPTPLARVSVVPYVAASTLDLGAGEGTRTVSLRVYYATYSRTMTSSIVVDMRAPRTSATLAPSYVGEAQVPLIPSDGLSGIAQTWWRVESGAWATGTVATCQRAGTHSVEYYSVDRAGNTETPTTVTVSIEPWPCSISGAASLVGASVASATVYLDGAEAAVTDSFGRFSISGVAPGQHALFAAAPGAVSQPAAVSVIFGQETSFDPVMHADLVTPLTRANVSSGGYAAWPAQIRLTATDGADSPGVARTWFTLDGVPGSGTTVPVIATTGIHSLQYWSADYAGNTEKARSIKFEVLKPPSATGVPSVPIAPVSVRHGKSFKVFGYLIRHTAGTSPVTLRFYRYQSGHWVLRKSISAKASDLLSFSKYSASTSVPYSGKWRVRARHKVGASYLYSGYRSFSAR